MGPTYRQHGPTCQPANLIFSSLFQTSPCSSTPCCCPHLLVLPCSISSCCSAQLRRAVRVAGAAEVLAHVGAEQEQTRHLGRRPRLGGKRAHGSWAAGLAEAELYLTGGWAAGLAEAENERAGPTASLGPGSMTRWRMGHQLHWGGARACRRMGYWPRRGGA